MAVWWCQAVNPTGVLRVCSGGHPSACHQHLPEHLGGQQAWHRVKSGNLLPSASLVF